MKQQTSCPAGQGALPPCAGPAVPFVAVQPAEPPCYPEAQTALSEGTLYPSLNLPFYLMVKGEPVEKTPLTELQALSFVLTELGLYLDTHPGDQEAFSLFRHYARCYRENAARYEEVYGPLEHINAQSMGCWARNPWPWSPAVEEG